MRFARPQSRRPSVARSGLPVLQISISDVIWTVFAIAVFFAYYRISPALGMLTAPWILFVAVSLKQAKRHNRLPGQLGACPAGVMFRPIVLSELENLRRQARLGFTFAVVLLLAAVVTHLWSGGDWALAAVYACFALERGALGWCAMRRIASKTASG